MFENDQRDFFRQSDHRDKNNIMINKQTVIDTLKRSMRKEGIM